MAYYSLRNLNGQSVVVAPFAELPDGPTADAWTFSKEIEPFKLTYRAAGPSEIWTEYIGNFEVGTDGEITGTVIGVYTWYIQEDPFFYEGQIYPHDGLYILDVEFDFAEMVGWLEQTSTPDAPWISTLPEAFFPGDDRIDAEDISIDGTPLFYYGGAGDDDIRQDPYELYLLMTLSPTSDISDTLSREFEYSVEEYLTLVDRLSAVIDGGTGDDLIYGSFSDNTLIGGAGDDRLYGFGGEDRFIGGPGDDEIWGTLYDPRETLHPHSTTSVYQGASTQYTLEIQEPETRIISSNIQYVIPPRQTSIQSYLKQFGEENPAFAPLPDGSYSTFYVDVVDRTDDRDGRDTLNDIEFVEFSNETVEMERLFSANTLTDDQATNLAEIYIAFFDRAPDALGLYFWADQMAQGMSLETISAHFATSPEAQALFPFASPASEVVTAIYENVLNRAPDVAGLAFWSNMLESGVFDRADLVMEVIRGAQAGDQPGDTPEISSQRAADALYLEAKTYLGLYFSAYLGMSDVENGAQAMAAFDGTPDGFATAKELIEGYHQDAIDPETGDLLITMVGITGDLFSDLGL